MKLALFQTRPQSSVEDALAALEDAAAKAAGRGADILVTTEMYLTGYAIGPARARKLAMSAGDDTLGVVADIARKHGIAILVGYPAANGDALPFNAVSLFGRDGAVLSTYYKSHLWLAVDGAQFSRGDALSEIIDFEGWKIGLGICYDIEFPEYARALRLAGADLILVPTACKKPYQSVSTRMVPTRAEENSMYVAYCNYCGSEGAIEYFGLSTVCGPTGETLVLAEEETGISYADLSREALTGWRAESDHTRDRRPDLYATLTEGKP